MNQSYTTPARKIALGGVLAALAVVLMSLGGLIPVATYTTPMLCTVLLQFVYLSCGRRIAWAWYGAVSILGLMLSADKEAAAVFVFLGYYPIVKPWMDRRKLPLLWKLGLFNGSMIVMYLLLLRVFGMAALNEEFADMGKYMVILLLILGNITFFLLDRVLGVRKLRIRKR